MSNATKKFAPGSIVTIQKANSRNGHTAKVESWVGHEGFGAKKCEELGKIAVRYDNGGWDAYGPDEISLDVDATLKAKGIEIGTRVIGTTSPDDVREGVVTETARSPWPVRVQFDNGNYGVYYAHEVEVAPTKVELPKVGSKVVITKAPFRSDLLGKVATVVEHHESLLDTSLIVSGENFDHTSLYADGDEITESEAKALIVNDALKVKGIEVGTTVVGTYPSGKSHQVKVTSINPKDFFPVHCEQGHLFLPKEVEVAPTKVELPEVGSTVRLTEVPHMEEKVGQIGTVMEHTERVWYPASGKVVTTLRVHVNGMSGSLYVNAEPVTEIDPSKIVANTISATSITVGRIAPVETFTEGDLLVVVDPGFTFTKGQVVKYVGIHSDYTSAHWLGEHIDVDLLGATGQGDGWSAKRFAKYDPAKYDNAVEPADLTEHIDAINEAIDAIASATAA